MIDTLPCSQCKHECCGPVPISKNRASRIQSFVDEMPDHHRDRLYRQKRKILDCGFLDLETGVCAIYEMRPQICRLFGSTEGMSCPKVEGLVRIVPPSTARLVTDMEYESGVAYLSSSFKWNKQNGSKPLQYQCGEGELPVSSSGDTPES